jgi:hypothetical protein
MNSTTERKYMKQLRDILDTMVEYRVIKLKTEGYEIELTGMSFIPKNIPDLPSSVKIGEEAGYPTEDEFLYMSSDYKPEIKTEAIQTP